jgi:hypothetical protein
MLEPAFDHRAGLEFSRRRKGDLTVRFGRGNLFVGIELTRCVPCLERDLNLHPERVEPVAPNEIENGDEHFTSR